jgi:hypothetical protein
MRQLPIGYFGQWRPVNITVDPHITTNIVDVVQVSTAISGFGGVALASNSSNVALH